MKKFLFCVILSLTLISICGCNKKIDYLLYLSENRQEVYLCREDGEELKIFYTRKEQPYNADGYVGQLSDICEIYYKNQNTPQSVTIAFDGFEGEMNYSSVDNNFYLSFSAPTPHKEEICVTLKIDEKEKTLSAKNVFEDGVITFAEAINCVIEYDCDYVQSLTQKNNFFGEIGVRLLYDERCFYYVSICNRSGEINAYLVDGNTGRVVAQKQTFTQTKRYTQP